MTQNSELNLLQCFVCQSNEFEQITLKQNLLDASDFCEVGSKNIGFTYVLTTCTKCGHSAIQTDNPCSMPTRKYNFIKYGEPIEHYPRVSSILRSLNIDFNDTSLHAFSYKDFQLANFLAKDLKISDCIINDYVTTTDYLNLTHLSLYGMSDETYYVARILSQSLGARTSNTQFSLMRVKKFHQP